MDENDDNGVVFITMPFFYLKGGE